MANSLNRNNSTNSYVGIQSKIKNIPSIAEIDRVNIYEFENGMDVELTNMGGEITSENIKKAQSKVLKNLKKDPAYYTNQLAEESIKLVGAYGSGKKPGNQTKTDAEKVKAEVSGPKDETPEKDKVNGLKTVGKVEKTNISKDKKPTNPNTVVKAKQETYTAKKANGIKSTMALPGKEKKININENKEYQGISDEQKAKLEKVIAYLKQQGKKEMADALERLMKSGIKDLDEKLRKNAPISKYVGDFEKSNAPQFKNKSSKERRNMAVAAYAEKNPGKLKEETSSYPMPDDDDFNITVGDNWNLSPEEEEILKYYKGEWKKIGNSLVLKSYLDLHHKPITSLPDNLKVKGNLNLFGSRITSLPDNLQVGSHLDLGKTKITSLPDNLQVGGNLALDNTPITSLPNNLKVGGSLNLRNTKVTSLPNDLKVGGKIVDFKPSLNELLNAVAAYAEKNPGKLKEETSSYPMPMEWVKQYYRVEKSPEGIKIIRKSDNKEVPLYVVGDHYDKFQASAYDMDTRDTSGTIKTSLQRQASQPLKSFDQIVKGLNKESKIKLTKENLSMIQEMVVEAVKQIKEGTYAGPGAVDDLKKDPEYGGLSQSAKTNAEKQLRSGNDYTI
jgi:hypothetical protein